MAAKKLTFPVMNVQMVPAAKVVANDYNPNKVAKREMELLIHSIEQDGFTQPVVVVRDEANDLFVVVDGFHRATVLKTHFKAPEIPVVVIDRPIQDRMAATVRHNRARGKHQVELMGGMVGKLLALGWTDSEIATHLGMEAEEVLRLRHQVGIASQYTRQPFGKAWVRDTGDVILQDAAS